MKARQNSSCERPRRFLAFAWLSACRISTRAKAPIGAAFAVENWLYPALVGNDIYLLIHSGSRGFGAGILREHFERFRFEGFKSTSPEAAEYLVRHEHARRPARACRANWNNSESSSVALQRGDDGRHIRHWNGATRSGCSGKSEE